MLIRLSLTCTLTETGVLETRFHIFSCTCCKGCCGCFEVKVSKVFWLVGERFLKVILTQQLSPNTSGSSVSPVHAWNWTAFWDGGSEGAWLQIVTFKQWIVIRCSAPALSRCRKFIWTRPTLNSSCSQTMKKHDYELLL